jgi:hypothetical protein
VIFEICGDHPILRAEAVSYLRSSAEISMRRLEAILQREVSAVSFFFSNSLRLMLRRSD